MKKGFTLIELLIVVAIIAILAAIAVPNFLEAQVRSKASRMKADMRSAATALEAYSVDHNTYPYDGYNYANLASQRYNYWYLPKDLTTPIAYVTSVNFVDPFRQHVPPVTWQFDNVRYTNVESTWGSKFDPIQNPSALTVSIYYDDSLAEWGGWRLSSAGPDKTYGPNGWPGVSSMAPFSYPVTALPLPYDPTNGTVSDGDVIRSQRASAGYVNAATN